MAVHRSRVSTNRFERFATNVNYSHGAHRGGLNWMQSGIIQWRAEEFMIAPGSIISCVVEASLLNGTSVVQQPLPCESSRRAIVLPFSPCKQIIPAWCNASATVRGLVYSANHVHPHDHVERR